MTFVAVTALAAAGAIIRWVLGRRFNAEQFPTGTFGVNMVGAFILGLLAGAGHTTLTVLGVGFLGSLTTFSTVMAETHTLAREHRLSAVLYVTLTVTVGIALAWLGIQGAS